MAMSKEEIRALAKAIVVEFFAYTDQSIGRGVRKKLVYITIVLLVVGGISLGIIHIPSGVSQMTIPHK